MKKLLIFALCSTFMLSSCDTYTGSGAYAGGSIGSILGSAIGGLSGGPRGSDMGTIIGMAGGAAVGAVIGSQADQQRAQPTQRTQRTQRSRAYTDNSYVNSSEIFDSSNSGDDRLYDFDSKDYTGNYSAQQPTTKMPTSTVEELGTRFSYSQVLEIVNARFVDDNENKVLDRNETCKLIFEIMNRGSQPVYDVVPTVIEATGNKHIFISPNIHVEKIEAGSGIRYTAMVKADGKLKDGTARFCVSVIHGGKAISKVNEFNIPTRGK